MHIIYACVINNRPKPNLTHNFRIFKMIQFSASLLTKWALWCSGSTLASYMFSYLYLAKGLGFDPLQGRHIFAAAMPVLRNLNLKIEYEKKKRGFLFFL